MRAKPLGPDFSINETTCVAGINSRDVKQHALVWSPTSATCHPNGLKAGADPFASVVARQLTQAAGRSMPRRQPPGSRVRPDNKFETEFQFY